MAWYQNDLGSSKWAVAWRGGAGQLLGSPACLSNSLLRRDEARAKKRAVRILVATTSCDRWATAVAAKLAACKILASLALEMSC